ncbi:hypothetical protein BGW80DRAFT_73251 [Lactifluus volemus]|nr:hypothetical protein BGW80DRAFT_73251 [Lactifluus volemus]
MSFRLSKLVQVRCLQRPTDDAKEVARPCRSCSTHGKECINPPKKGRRNGTRVKAACVKCRQDQDKVRCDDQGQMNSFTRARLRSVIIRVSER